MRQKMVFSRIHSDNGSLPVVYDRITSLVYVPVEDLLGLIFQYERNECTEQLERANIDLEMSGRTLSLVERSLDGSLKRMLCVQIDVARSILSKYAEGAFSDLLCQLAIHTALPPCDTRGIVVDCNGLYVEECLAYDASVLWDDELEEGVESDPYDEYESVRIAGGDVWLTPIELSKIICVNQIEIENRLSKFLHWGNFSLPVATCARYVKDSRESIVYGLSATMPLLTVFENSNVIRFRRWLRLHAKSIGPKAHLLDWKQESEFERSLMSGHERVTCFEFCKKIDSLVDGYVKSPVTLWPAADPDHKYFEARLMEELCRFELRGPHLMDGEYIFTSRYAGIRLNNVIGDAILSYKKAFENGSGYAAYKLSLFCLFLAEQCEKDAFGSTALSLDKKLEYEAMAKKYYDAAVCIGEPHAVLQRGIMLKRDSKSRSMRLIKRAAETGLTEAMMKFAEVLEEEGSAKCRVWYNMVIKRETELGTMSYNCQKWIERLACQYYMGHNEYPWDATESEEAIPCVDENEDLPI